MRKKIKKKMKKKTKFTFFDLDSRGFWKISLQHV